MKRVFLYLIIFFLFIPALYANAHPHVFVFTSVDAVFNEQGLTGFNVYWKFDEMFSHMFIFDFDKNRNRKFEKDELIELENGAFKNLKNFDYFSHIKIENKKFKVQYVKDFNAWIKGNNLFYSFFIPCTVKAYERDKDIKVAIYDKSFYCSVFLTRNPLYFKDADKFLTTYRIDRNEADAYYFDQIVPKEINIKFRLKND